MSIARRSNLRFVRAGVLTQRRARWLLLLLLASNLYFAWDKWSGPVRDQIAMLSTQRKCLRFEMPADQVVFEGDPKRSAVLLDSNHDYEPIEDQSGSDRRAAAWLGARDPFRRFLVSSNVIGDGVDLDWVDSLTGRGTIVFMHQRTSQGGSPRLVVIEAIDNDDGGVILSTKVIIPERCENRRSKRQDQRALSRGAVARGVASKRARRSRESPCIASAVRRPYRTRRTHRDSRSNSKIWTAAACLKGDYSTMTRFS